MAEYIEREKARDAIEDADSYYTYVIDKLPSADVAPVRHGHWIPVDEQEDAFDCSECDAMVSKRVNYCPKCGARMDDAPTIIPAEGVDEMNENTMPAYEQYEIVYRRTLTNEKGKTFECEEPIVVRAMVGIFENAYPSVYMVNEMLEKLRMGLLQRLKE